jgi:ribosome-associated protein
MILFRDGRWSSFHFSALFAAKELRGCARVSDAKPSKSARKRQHLALQELGEALIRLSRADLESLSLDNNLREAVIDAGGIQSHSALRRQRQLIGKLMRDADADAIRAALAALGQADRNATGLFHSAERWRDRILAEGEPAVAEFSARTGTSPAELTRLATELKTANSEFRRRNIGRRIFREVHAGIMSSPQPITKPGANQATE